MIMTLMYDRRSEGATWDQGGLVPRVKKKLSQLKKKYHHYTVSNSTDLLWVVRDKFSQTWTVDVK